MITFKSPKDLSKLPATHPAFPAVSELVDSLIEGYTWERHPYDPEHYGYVILVEPEDVDRSLDEVWEGCLLVDIPWEGIFLRDGFFTAIYLANNEYGLCFVIPDEDWVTGKLREVIEDHLDP